MREQQSIELCFHYLSVSNFIIANHSQETPLVVIPFFSFGNCFKKQSVVNFPWPLRKEEKFGTQKRLKKKEKAKEEKQDSM